jgi:DNA (cytosine-5)-methyltransferase 1
MKFIDLFAGVGGFRRGMELAGHECVGFCEWDKFAAASYTSMHLLTDEQRSRLADMDLKARQKEILKEEYRNGEWYSADVRLITADNVPRADCWCFGAPCQDFSIAGQRKGLDGDRSSLVREVFRVLGECKEEDRPEWLIYENVKGMLSSNRGFDFLAILLELDELGYDCEWEIFNTKNFGVPQNRERVYTVGHLRSRGRKQIFPLKGADGEDSVCEVNQIGMQKSHRTNPNQYRLYDTEREDRGVSNYKHTGTAVAVGFVNPEIDGSCRTLKAQMAKNSLANFIRTDSLGATAVSVAIPVLTPDRADKRQNGRRFKDNGDESFTLTAQDRHGVALKVDDKEVYAVWYEKYNCYIAIRKLTPRECFRLQGWTDDYFEKAAFVNSDSQLYKQAGNGVTVDVVQAIAEKLKESEAE